LFCALFALESGYDRFERFPFAQSADPTESVLMAMTNLPDEASAAAERGHSRGARGGV
jgi:hypothetical protein